MQSQRSSGLLDLRKGRAARRPPKGQVRLFSPRAPEPPRRPMPLRAKRRRIRALGVLGILLLCAGIFYTVSWVSYLPQLNVSSISISGVKDINEELVTRSIEAVLEDGTYHILSRRNIFLYPRQNIESVIMKSFPLVKTVHVSRSSFLATGIDVTIEEREPFARWCGDTSLCYFMDEGGFIYASVGSNTDTSTLSVLPSTQYVFSGDIASSTEPIGQWFVKAHLPGLLSLLKFLGQAGFAPLDAQVDGQDIFVLLQDGFLLKVSFGADAGTLVKNLQLVLSSDVLQGKQDEIEYIDLRFGNRVYFKLKGQDEVSTE